MHELKKPKFLDGVELPASYYHHRILIRTLQIVEISLLALSRYARSRNKRIIDLSCEEVLQFRTPMDEEQG